KRDMDLLEHVQRRVTKVSQGKEHLTYEDGLKGFHVDKLSSAHVYLRLHKGQTVDDIPKEVLIDCAHLVKANSIQGGSASHWGWVQGVCGGCFCSTRACV
uniref:Coiled-coil domain-containing protein 25 n=1 Tax=Phasianus colchicus TaxID=9054 RepID=A0A669Q7G8_PHACC